MIRNIVCALAFVSAATANAECIEDQWEIGDTGPGSSLVCSMLQSRFPEANLEVLDRELHDPGRVSVIVGINGQPQRLDYVLAGPDWILATSAVASRP